MAELFKDYRTPEDIKQQVEAFKRSHMCGGCAVKNCVVPGLAVKFAKPIGDGSFKTIEGTIQQCVANNPAYAAYIKATELPEAKRFDK